MSVSGIINTHFIVAHMIARHGTAGQKDYFPPRMAVGEVRGAFSMSEPGLGSELPLKTFRVSGGDVMSGAPESARLTLNMAKVHHDQTARAAGRLAYGGHTIGIALHQAVRAIPGMVTVVGWRSCDHAGPVWEGDTLTSAIEVEQTDRPARGGTVARLRSRVRATRPDTLGADVLDWRSVALLA